MTEKLTNLNKHRSVYNELLFRNRKRCCICRNPTKPIEIYRLNGTSHTSLIDILAILCIDCFNFISKQNKEKDEESFERELFQYKKQWEHECEVWREGDTDLLIILDEDLEIISIENDAFQYIFYDLKAGDSIDISIKSDEPIVPDVRRVYITENVGYEIRDIAENSLLDCKIGYEFNVSFRCKRNGHYTFIIEKKSSEKTTAIIHSPSLVGYKIRTSHPIKEEENINIDTLQNTETNTQTDNFETSADYIPWTILPAGEQPFPHILSHYEFLKRSSFDVQIASERLKLIETLKPAKTYKGLDEFDGYFVFYFAETGIAVLECPLKGNAIYIIRNDWETLSKCTKAELLTSHQSNVTRIVHSGDWFSRLRKIISTDILSHPTVGL